MIFILGVLNAQITNNENLVSATESVAQAKNLKLITPHCTKIDTGAPSPPNVSHLQTPITSGRGEASARSPPSLRRLARACREKPQSVARLDPHGGPSRRGKR
jgi:hypothetical protein